MALDSMALALPAVVPEGSRAIGGSVVHFLFLAGIIVAGQLAALDIIIVLVLVSILISLLLG